MLNELTNAVRDAAAETAGLAAVHLAATPGPFDSARLPAATLTLDETRRPTGDDLDGLWQVRYELTLWRRDGSRAANAEALLKLADAVTEALLADPTQGGLAVPGPAGLPTEILGVEPGRSGRDAPPLGSLTLRLACWVMPPDGVALLPQAQRVQIDGQSLFATGPHALTVGGWQRRRLDRHFAGLDGTVSIDLGATHRPMSLAGRLVADTPADLLEQIAAVEALNGSGGLHAVAAPDSRSFSNVRVEQIRWGRVLSPGTDRTACVGYQVSLSQLASAM